MENSESNIIIYNTIDGRASVVLYARDGSVWMNQNQLAELFDTSKQGVGQHIANILNERELDADSVVKKFFTTAADGKNYEVTFYSLEMIMAIGFRVRSKRGTQFRIWANQHLTEYLVKGFTMDDERLKNPNGSTATTVNPLPDPFAETGRTPKNVSTTPGCRPGMPCRTSGLNVSRLSLAA
jgi:hypothetical protein